MKFYSTDIIRVTAIGLGYIGLDAIEAILIKNRMLDHIP